MLFLFTRFFNFTYSSFLNLKKLFQNIYDFLKPVIKLMLKINSKKYLGENFSQYNRSATVSGRSHLLSFSFIFYFLVLNVLMTENFLNFYYFSVKTHPSKFSILILSLKI